jgi:hypothetical protein
MTDDVSPDLEEALLRSSEQRAMANYRWLLEQGTKNPPAGIAIEPPSGQGGGDGISLLDVVRNVADIPRSAAIGVGAGLFESARTVGGLSLDITGQSREIFNQEMDEFKAGMPAPHTRTGSAVAGISQWLTGFLTARRALPGGGATGRAAQGARALGAGFIADAGFFESHAEGLANLAQEYPELQGVITDTLAVDTEDGEWEARAKRGLEGFVLGGTQDAFMHGLRAVRKGLRHARAGEQGNPAEFAKAVADTEAALTAGKVETADRDYLLALSEGKPEEPLVFEQRAAPVKTNVEQRLEGEDVAAGHGEHRVQAERLAAPAADQEAGKVYVNWGRIKSGDDVKAAAQMLADMGADSVNEARRGVVTHARAKHTAAHVNAFEALNRQRALHGEAVLVGEQQLAMRQLWVSSIDKTIDIAEHAAKNPTPGNLIAFRRMMATHAMIQDTVIGARTETARALNFWSIPAGTTGAKMRQLESLIQAGGGLEDMAKMAEHVAMLKSVKDKAPEKIGAIAKGSLGARTASAFYYAWINGLLSNPPTHVVNAVSNALIQVYEPLVKGVASRVGRALGNEGGVVVGESSAEVFGFIEGLKDAFRLGGEGKELGLVWQAANDPQSAKLGHHRLDAVKNEGYVPISAEAFNLPEEAMVGRLVNALGVGVGIPVRSLQASDAYFKATNNRMVLAALARRQAMHELPGLIADPAAFDAKFATLLGGPPTPDDLEALRGNPEAAGRALERAYLNNPTEEMTRSAWAEAERRTFTDPTGRIGRGVKAMLANIPVLKLFIPFVNTLVNLTRYAIESTPLAPASKQFREDIAAGGARAEMAVTRMAVGTAAALTFVDMALQGEITGRAPTEQGARDLFYRSGRQPYSRRIGDKWFSYSRTDPLGMSLGWAADLVQAGASEDFSQEWHENASEAAGALVFALAGTAMSKTYISNMADLFKTMAQPDRGEDFLTRLAGTIVPTGVAGAARVIDPTLRDTNSIVDGIVARTPWGSDTLPAKRDLWGRVIDLSSPYGSAYQYFSPIGVRVERPEPIDKELQRIGHAPQMPAKARTMHSLRGEPVQIDFGHEPELYWKYVELAGNGAKHPMTGKGVMDTLNEMVQGKGPLGLVYKEAIRQKGWDGAAEVIDRIIRDGRDLAAIELSKMDRVKDLIEATAIRERARLAQERRQLP